MSGAYTNDAQQRILRLLQTLAGNEITGLAPAEIARAQACSAPMVTRDLANLVQAGLAEQVPETGRWRLTPVLIQLAFKHMATVERAEKKLTETQNRYTRS